MNTIVSIPVKIKRVSMEKMFSLIDNFKISMQPSILVEILNKIKYFVLIIGGFDFIICSQMFLWFGGLDSFDGIFYAKKYDRIHFDWRDSYLHNLYL